MQMRRAASEQCKGGVKGCDRDVGGASVCMFRLAEHATVLGSGARCGERTLVVDNFVRRVIVGVDGSVGSVRALRRGVAEARLRGATVYAVFAWTPPGGEVTDRRAPDAHLRLFWEMAAWERLLKTWNESLGGFPSDVEVRLLVARGAPGRALVSLADDENDLLVIGAGRRSPLRRAFVASVARHCAARACCPVLVVPPSPLARLEPGVLSRIVRRRRAADELVSHIQQ